MKMWRRRLNPLNWNVLHVLCAIGFIFGGLIYLNAPEPRQARAQFQPLNQATTLPVVTSSGSTALPATGSTLFLFNDGGNELFWTFGPISGGNAPTATINSFPLPAGACVAYQIPDTGPAQQLFLAAITANGSTTLRATRGYGQLGGACGSGGGGNSSVAPPGATFISINNTGTTAAVTATLAGVANKFTYLCGYTIGALATAATTGTVSIAGITTPITPPQNVAAGTTAQAISQQSFTPCIPSSAVNTSITVTTVAAGTGGVTNIAAWGFLQ